MQFAFSYYWYLMSRQQEFDPEQEFEQLDLNHDGTSTHDDGNNFAIPNDTADYSSSSFYEWFWFLYCCLCYSIIVVLFFIMFMFMFVMMVISFIIFSSCVRLFLMHHYLISKRMHKS